METLLSERFGWRLWVMTTLVLFVALPILWLPDYSTTLEKICAVAMLFSVGTFHVHDIVQLARSAFVKRYVLTVTLQKREKHDYLTTAAFSTRAHDFYSRRLLKYPIGQYVYVVKDASVSGLYKIGKTNNPARRLHRFDVILPFAIHIMAIIPCDNATRLEQALHGQYWRKRVSGEWFNLDGDDLERILPVEIKAMTVAHGAAQEEA